MAMLKETNNLILNWGSQTDFTFGKYVQCTLSLCQYASNHVQYDMATMADVYIGDYDHFGQYDGILKIFLLSKSA